MMPYGISRIVGGVSTRMGSPSSRSDNGDAIRLRWLKDLSGSVARHVETIARAEDDFVRKVLADPLLRNRLCLAATEMSGAVVSSPYMGPAEFRPPGLQAGGFSPHAAMLRSALQADAQHGVPVAATVHVVLCDGKISGESLNVGQVVEEYRAAQERDPDCHVFVVELGDAAKGEINTDFTRHLSVRHEAIGRADIGQAFTDAAEAIFKILSNAVRAPSGDVSRIIGQSASLDVSERQVDSGLGG